MQPPLGGYTTTNRKLVRSPRNSYICLVWMKL